MQVYRGDGASLLRRLGAKKKKVSAGRPVPFGARYRLILSYPQFSVFTGTPPFPLYCFHERIKEKTKQNVYSRPTKVKWLGLVDADGICSSMVAGALGLSYDVAIEEMEAIDAAVLVSWKRRYLCKYYTCVVAQSEYDHSHQRI